MFSVVGISFLTVVSHIRRFHNREEQLLVCYILLSPAVYVMLTYVAFYYNLEGVSLVLVEFARELNVDLTIAALCKMVLLHFNLLTLSQAHHAEIIFYYPLLHIEARRYTLTEERFFRLSRVYWTTICLRIIFTFHVVNLLLLGENSAKYQMVLFGLYFFCSYISGYVVSSLYLAIAHDVHLDNAGPKISFTIHFFDWILVQDGVMRFFDIRHSTRTALVTIEMFLAALKFRYIYSANSYEPVEDSRSLIEDCDTSDSDLFNEDQSGSNSLSSYRTAISNSGLGRQNAPFGQSRVPIGRPVIHPILQNAQSVLKGPVSQSVLDRPVEFHCKDSLETDMMAISRRNSDLIKIDEGNTPRTNNNVKEISEGDSLLGSIANGGNLDASDDVSINSVFEEVVNNVADVTKIEEDGVEKDDSDLEATSPGNKEDKKCSKIASNRSLYVGNLALDVTDTVLHKTFADKYRSVEGAKAVIHRKTRVPKRFGFVKFGDDNERNEAMKEMDGALCSSRPMRVAAAAFGKSSGFIQDNQKQDQKCSKIASTRSLYVGNLALDVTDTVLQNTFAEKYESVEGAKVVIHRKTRLSKGFGFVKFGDDNERNEAMKEMDGAFCSSRPMRVAAATFGKSSGFIQGHSKLKNGDKKVVKTEEDRVDDEDEKKKMMVEQDVRLRIKKSQLVKIDDSEGKESIESVEKGPIIKKDDKKACPGDPG